MTDEIDYEQRSKFTRELPVQLNEHELQMYGQQLAVKVNEVAMLEEKKKQVGQEWANKIKAGNLEVKRLADARAKGEELRPVMCAERLHGNVIEIVRLDTKPPSVVDTRPAELSDLQTEIPDIDQPPPRTGAVIKMVPPIDPGGDVIPPGEAPGEGRVDLDRAAPEANAIELFDCSVCGEKILPDVDSIIHEDIGMVHVGCLDEDTQNALHNQRAADEQTAEAESEGGAAAVAIAQRDRDIAQREREIAEERAAVGAVADKVHEGNKARKRERSRKAKK